LPPNHENNSISYIRVATNNRFRKNAHVLHSKNVHHGLYVLFVTCKRLINQASREAGEQFSQIIQSSKICVIKQYKKNKPARKPCR